MSIAPKPIFGPHGGNPYHDPRNGRFTTADGAAGRSQSVPVEQVRSRIVKIAKSYVGSKQWEFHATAQVPDSYTVFGDNSYKCNLFVYYVLKSAGASPGLPNGRGRWLGFGNPPAPSQWADPNFAIPGWKVIGAGERPKPGDVVAQKLGYSDADGHVMIVGHGGDGRLTFVGTGPAPEDIVEIPMRSSLGPRGIQAGRLVFRRWQGN